MEKHILPKIQSPKDVHRLKACCLPVLAGEIRETIIETTAKNGGHLASNLGMVETTIALHRVFGCPRDTIFFDVSHQAYAHKLLTGRYGDFHTLRQAGGLSGFTNREESRYDAVTAGHSGSALSAAIGMAEANRLKKNGAWTVAVVGDGSFTNGMVYEALNQLALRNLRIILVLNDNEMSISKNVGGLSDYLAYIRTSAWYFNFKDHARRTLEAIPAVGEALVSAARSARDTVKRLTNSETWFESFGLEYIGPADGNNLGQMIGVLGEAKKKNGPVIVHIRTKKGLGFAPSEAHPERYHSIGAFSPDAPDDMPQAQNRKNPPAKQTFAEIVSDEIVRAAEEDERICAITAAMTEGCGLTAFAQTFPERFFDTGIAEEHAVTMAGGLSLGGMLPVTVLYTTFAQRVYDQMWHDVALQKAKAVFLFSHAGLVPGDGVTHQGLCDLALFSGLDGMHIFSPDTFAAWRACFAQAREDTGISIIRYPKGGEAVYPGGVQWKTAEDGTALYKKTFAPSKTAFAPSKTTFAPYKTAAFAAGNASPLLTEKQMLIFTYGRIAENVVKAVCDVSAVFGQWTFTVVVLEQIIPLPLTEELLGRIENADRILVIEEHQRCGGIGEKLAAHPQVLRNISVCAVENAHIPHGDRDSLERLCGLDVHAIGEKICAEITKKTKIRLEME